MNVNNIFNTIPVGIQNLNTEEVPTNWNSIYIPRIDFRWTREELVRLFETDLVLGKVARIDFAPTKDGSGRMAFIHFIAFFQNIASDKIRTTMEECPLGIEIADEFNIYPNIKMRCAINRRPIPKTEFTIETLTDSVTRMGYTVEQHCQELEKMKYENSQYREQMCQWSIAQTNIMQKMLARIDYLEQESMQKTILIERLESTIFEMQLDD
jgi:hypothetical protein